MIARFWAFLLVALAMAAPTSAHEVRPAYLEITAQGEGAYTVNWKQPVVDGRRLQMTPQIGPECEETGARRFEAVENAVIERWDISCAAPVTEVEIAGLDRTLTDAIMRLETGEGTQTAILRPDAPRWLLGENNTPASYAYFVLGIEHILFGPDHLLFVAGLVLLLGGKRIIWAVTAFTVAHSITLALAALGRVSLPAGPVEIMIAASIVLVAIEGLLLRAGRPSLVSRHPWPVIFVIGLLHGLGFAGALGELGLPSGEEALALLLFNLGIEVGQVGFVLVLVGLLWFLSRLYKRLSGQVEVLLLYAIGTCGAFWTLQRIFG